VEQTHSGNRNATNASRYVTLHARLRFALRAGQEHRALRVGENGQITVKRGLQNRRYLEYHEDVSKTNRGGIQHRKIQPKITRAYENIAKPERCPVNIYEKYISLR
jgi:hypothetical protein